MSSRAGRVILMMASAVLLAVSANNAQAGLITFDDLPTTGASPIPNGYGGLDWSNFYYATSSFVGGGYINGTVSPENVAFNAGGNPAAASADPFSINSMYLTAAWNDGLSIQISGYNGATLLDQVTEVVNTSGPTLVTLNWSNLTELDFASSGGVNHGYGGIGTQFVLDNMLINSQATPEPASFCLLGIGLVGMCGVARRRLPRNDVAA